MPRQIKKHPQCIYGNQCAVFCVNPNCKKPGFICEKGVNNRNQCGLFHETCQKMSWAELNHIIYENPNTRTSEFTEFIEEMETFFSNLVKKMKEEHLKFKVFIRTFGYSQTMMRFIQQINNEDYDKITGHHLNDIISQLFIKDETRLKSEFIFQRKVFETISSQITGCLNKIQNIYKKPIDGINAMELIQKFELNPETHGVYSNITNDFDFIRSLFPPNRKIKKFKLIFRASEHGFSAQAFHRRCDNTPNTLVLVKTQFGKIIGGFTGLTWNSSKKHRTTDKDLSSLVFSVTMRQKFTLNLSQFAIACNQQKGPIFGCCDICIVDRSDRQVCNAEFPISYSNFKHTRSLQTNLQFIGNETVKFRTMEWEVFLVEFENS